MRRKIAALLCAVLCLTAFSGCSQTELGYLAMSADVAQVMKQSEITGTAEVYLDVDALKSFVVDTSVQMGATQEDAEAMAASFGEISGKKTAVVEYTMQMDLDQMRYMFDVDLTYDSKIYSFGRLYYGVREGVYVSTEALWSAYRLVCEMTENDGSFLYDEAFAEEWKAKLDADKYVCVLDMQDLGLTEEELDALVPADGFDELMNAALDMYKEGFSGFTTDMVTEIPDGYRFEATGMEVGKMTASLLQYVAEHPTEVMNAIEKYLQASMEYAGADEVVMQDLTDSFAAAKEDTESVSAMALEAKAAVEGVLADARFAPMLEGFSYTSDVVKQADYYGYKESYVFKDGNKTVFTINSDSVMRAKDNSVVFPSQSVSMDEVAAQTTELVDKYNPVTGVTVTWYPADGSSEAVMQLQRESMVAALTGMDTSLVSYQIVDGRAYLPLRAVCDALGQDVTWNAATRTASVTVDGKEVQVDSKLVDGTSYVGVRGLEVLGYQVAYENAEGMHMATVTK